MRMFIIGAFFFYLSLLISSVRCVRLREIIFFLALTSKCKLFPPYRFMYSVYSPSYIFFLEPRTIDMLCLLSDIIFFYWYSIFWDCQKFHNYQCNHYSIEAFISLQSNVISNQVINKGMASILSSLLMRFMFFHTWRCVRIREFCFILSSPTKAQYLLHRLPVLRVRVRSHLRSLCMFIILVFLFLSVCNFSLIRVH